MKDEQPKNDINWAEVVDMLAHEYGWTIAYIQSLTMSQTTLLIEAITKRNRAAIPESNRLSTSAKNKNGAEKFQADDTEKQIGMMVAWGAKKEIGKDGKERYIL